MTQATNLQNRYHPDGVYSFIVGSVAIVANTLYVRNASGLLVQATASDPGPYFFPHTAEGAGMPVSASLIGTGTFNILASGSIAKSARVMVTTGGKVCTATAGYEIVGTTWEAADNGELVSVVTAATVGGIYPTINEAAHGEKVEEGWISEEITLETGSATSIGLTNLFPANSWILGAVIRVTEAINNRAAVIVGLTAGDLDGLVATGTALTLNATAVGAGALIGTFNVAAATATITTSGGTQNTTGKVRVSVNYRKYTAPTS